VNSLIKDYSLISGDKSLRVVQNAIELSSHILSRDKTQLAGQLLGRIPLTDYRQAGVMIQRAMQRRVVPWLRPLRPTLPGPDTQLAFTLEGHTDWVTGLSVTPDSRFVVSASRDRTIRIWCLERKQEIGCLRKHMGVVDAMTLTPDGRCVLSCFRNGKVKVWNLEIMEPIGYMKAHKGWATAVVVTPDSRFALSSIDGNLQAWNLNQNREQWCVHVHGASAISSNRVSCLKQ